MSYYRVLLEPSSGGVVGFASINRISSIGADVFILSMSRTFIGTPGAIADERVRDSALVYMRALAGVRPDTAWRSLLTERTDGVLFP